MARFYNKQEDGFEPRYGDIDWRALLMAKLLVNGQKLEGDPVWFDSEDGLDVQCTQENTDIYVNKASDDMDAVLVLDPRDEQRFSFFRSTIGDETFNLISESLQTLGAAAVHWSLYPRDEIAELWVKQNTDDDLSGFIPEDWLKI